MLINLKMTLRISCHRRNRYNSAPTPAFPIALVIDRVREQFVAIIARHWEGVAAYCDPQNKVTLWFV